MRALLWVFVLLAAGCTTGGGHEGHGMMEALVGVTNVGTQPAAFTLRIEGPVGSGPMEATVGVQPNATAERFYNLTNEGDHRAIVEWARGRVVESWSTRDCRSFHVVFSIDPAQTGEINPDRIRECH